MNKINDMDNTNKLNLKISSSIFILIVPAISVFFLYSYEIGFADYFGIPFSLVSMKSTEFYPYIIWNILLIIMLSTLLLSIIPFYNFYYPEKETISKCWRGIILFVIRFGVLFLICKFQYDLTNQKALFYYVLSGMVVLLLCFSALDNLFMRAPDVSEKTNHNVIRAFLSRENSYTYFILVLLIQWVIYLSLIYTSLGYSSAKSKNTFLSFDMDNEKYLIIAMYDDCCIVKKKTAVEKRNNSHFIKMNKENLNDQELEWMTIDLQK